MTEINEKDLERATGGTDPSSAGYARHEKTYSCPFFENPTLSELKAAHNITDLALNCYVCSHAKSVGDGTEDVYCLLGQH